MVKVKGTKICQSCIYWSGYSLGCSYMVEKNKSRLRDENGNKINPDYCDKYEKGKKSVGQVWIQLRKGSYKNRRNENE